MKTSIVSGALLPESAAEFATLRAPRYRVCIFCEAPFSDANVKSALGWRETQISGTCESCWDEAFAPDSVLDIPCARAGVDTLRECGNDSCKAQGRCVMD